MAAERTLYTFTGHPLYKVRLIERDVTDPTIHVRSPYALVVTRTDIVEYTVAEFTRDQLRMFAEVLTGHLVRR